MLPLPDILPLGRRARGCRAEGRHAAGRARAKSSGALVLHQVGGGLHPVTCCAGPARGRGGGQGGTRGVLTRGPGDATLAQTRPTSKFIPVCGLSRRRQWHPTPVLLFGKSHGRRSLVGCSPWGRKESDTTEQLPFHFSLSCIGEANGNPLQCYCLENPRAGGTWWAAISGVAQSQT